jgi:hypothetical protein
MTSVKISLDERLLGISCDALDDIRGWNQMRSFEEALKFREIDQLHDALTLIRSGILSFRNEEAMDGKRIVVISIAFEK